MADTEKKDTAAEPPKPEVLKAQSDGESTEPEETKSSSLSSQAASATPQKQRLRRTTYRPSHKATFIGLAVIIVILAINAGIILFVLNGQSTPTTSKNLTEVTLSTSSLNKLGVSRNPVGDSAEELVVGPNSRFNGTVTVGSNVSIGGQLTLNNKVTANEASLTNLQAGDTSLSQLNVNGDGTVSNFNLRQNLTVVGTSVLQGPVTLSQLLTVNNSVNVVGNLAVGGQLTVRSFQASNLVSDTTLTIGGHIITSGQGPSFARGSVLRGVDTVSVGGNDTAGTVQINIGAGSVPAGTLIQVAFHRGFSNTPHVVVSPVGGSLGNYYVNRNSSGFSIVATGSVPYGGYAFDYIVMQ